MLKDLILYPPTAHILVKGNCGLGCDRPMMTPLNMPANTVLPQNQASSAGPGPDLSQSWGRRSGHGVGMEEVLKSITCTTRPPSILAKAHPLWSG